MLGSLTALWIVPERRCEAAGLLDVFRAAILKLGGGEPTAGAEAQAASAPAPQVIVERQV